MTLAIFDLDNTLLADDSDHLWGEYLCDRGLVDEAHFRAKNDAFYEDYKLARLNIDAYLRFVLHPIKGLSQGDVDALHSDFFEDYIRDVMLPQAIECVEQHQRAGHTCMVITATSEFITAPIVRAFGIEHLIASEAELADGRYTGNPAGTPSFAAGKVTRLESWLSRHPKHQGSHKIFYSDSLNDIPLLEKVDEPVAVDPDETLRQEAQRRGWKIISFRG